MRIRSEGRTGAARGISLKVLIATTFSVILIVSLFGCGLLVIRAYSDYIAELSIKQNLNYASQLSHTIITTISNLDADLRVMSKLDEIEGILRKESALDERDVERFERAIDELLSFNRQMYYYMSSLTLYTANGHRLNYGYYNYPVEDVFHSRYYDMGMRYPVNLVWLGYNRENQKYEAVKMIYDENYIITGMMILMFTDNYFKNMMAGSQYTEMADVYLINERSQIQYAPCRERIGEDFDPALVARMGRIEGCITSDGSLVMHHKLKGTTGNGTASTALVPSWRVVLMVNRATLMHEADMLTSRLSLLIAFIALAAIFIIAYITHLTTRPINSLSRAIKLLAASGRFEQHQKQRRSFYREANELIGTYNCLITEINRLIDDNLAEKQMLLRMQQKILESQLAPHFLFNALQVISLQAHEANDEPVYKTIGNLSYLLTENLRSAGQFTTVANELLYIRAYMSIIEAKYEDKIGYEIQAEPGLMEFFIPKFMLQPLVENAIVHGLIPKFTKGRLWIRIRSEGDFVEFTVKDDGVGISQAQREQILRDATVESFSPEQSGRHIGIINIFQRLRIIYQDRFDFSFEGERYEGTQITIRLPRDGELRERYR